jgi:hypothetical protein
MTLHYYNAKCSLSMKKISLTCFKIMLIASFTAPSLSYYLENDRDAAIITLAQLEVHRCALICTDGSAVQKEANLVDIHTEIPSLYTLDDDGVPIHRFDRLYLARH